MGTWEVLKGFGTAIKNYVINRIQDLLSGITGMGSALKAFFSGHFKGAFEIGKKAVGDLMGADSKKKLTDDGMKAAKSFSKGYNDGVKMKAVEAGVDIKTGKPKPKDVLKQDQSKVFADLMNDTGKGKGKKGKDMGGKDNARKFASKREQTELARSLPSGSKLSKAAKPSREEWGYTVPHGKKYTKDDWK